MKNVKKINCFKTNKAWQKRGHPFVSKTILKEHSLSVNALRKGEQQVLVLFYRNIYRIRKTNFQQNPYLHEVYLSYFQLVKKTETISLKVFKIMAF